MKVALVVVAAGSGTRFGSPKQFALLGGVPLIGHSLIAFDAMEFDDRVVVLSEDLSAAPEWRDAIKGLAHPVRVVEGGAERVDSVREGVAASDSYCDLVVVHDGARPFPPVAAVRRCIDMLSKDHQLACAIVAAPVTDTLKALDADGTISHTIERARTVRAETPQVCNRKVLLDALAAPIAAKCTDEAQAIELAGHRSAVVLHKGFNIKITTPADLVAAEAWLAKEATP